jgi:hypothetical protein
VVQSSGALGSEQYAARPYFSSNPRNGELHLAQRMKKSLHGPVAEGDGRQARGNLDARIADLWEDQVNPDSARGRQPCASRPKRTPCEKKGTESAVCVVACVVTLPSLPESQGITRCHSVSRAEDTMCAKGAWILVLHITCSPYVSHHRTRGQDLTR